MRRIAGAALVLVLAAGTGCTDDPEPRFEDPTGSPSASDSTSPAADEKEPWEERSKAGAVAFAKHWVDIFNEAQKSGDTSNFKMNNTKRCVSCRELTVQLEDIYADGGSLQSEGWRVLNTALRPESAGSTVEVVVRIDRSPQRIIQGDGHVERFPGGEATFSMGLVWTDAKWLLDELVRL